MKKEVLIAIIIGFGLGLVITFGIWSANKAIKTSAPEATPEPEQTMPTPTPSPAPVLSLTITEPEENLLVNEEAITISGQTAKEAIVILLYPEGEKILQADEQGQFTTEIELAGGVNEIKITAYDKEGNQEETTLRVVYSTAEI